jgi:hypothetical protein
VDLREGGRLNLGLELSSVLFEGAEEIVVGWVSELFLGIPFLGVDFVLEMRVGPALVRRIET